MAKMSSKVEINESLKRILDDTMNTIDASIEKINMKLDNGAHWSTEDKMNTYTKIYKALTLREPVNVRNYVLNALYDKYERVLNQRISENVIPSLVNKEGKLLLNELVNQYWSKQEEYTKNVVKIFHCVEHFGPAVRIDKPSSLTETSKMCFCHLVWRNFLSEIDNALIELREENPANDEDKVELNTLKTKVTEFFSVMEHISDERFQNSFQIWRKKIKKQI